MKHCTCDILCFFSVLATLSLKTNKGSVLLDIVVKLSEIQLTEKKHTCLQVMVELYNTDTDISRKYQLLLSLLNYALVTNQSELIFSQFYSVVEWEKELQITHSIPLQRDLCLSFLKLFQNQKSYSSILTRYLSTFEEESEDVIYSSENVIRDHVLHSLKALDVFNFDHLLHLRVFNILSDRHISKLLKIFALGGYKDFQEFCHSYPSFLNESDEKILLEKIRLLSITSLCSQKQIISFSDVVALIDVEIDDVEMWVVDATSKSLVSLKIDQPQQLIHVTYSMKRNFDQSDWETVGIRVNNCRENISSLLETVRRAKQAQLSNQ